MCVTQLTYHFGQRYKANGKFTKIKCHMIILKEKSQFNELGT